MGSIGGVGVQRALLLLRLREWRLGSVLWMKTGDLEPAGEAALRRSDLGSSTSTTIGRLVPVLEVGTIMAGERLPVLGDDDRLRLSMTTGGPA